MGSRIEAISGTEVAETITKKFAETLQQAINRRLLTREYLTNYDYQKGRRAHGRITGILARVGSDLGYALDLDCSYFALGRFDLIYLNDENVIALLDYESLNSYDLRGKPQHFENYIRKCVEKRKDNFLPEACILIVTLPISSVKSIPEYCNEKYCSQYQTEWHRIFQNAKDGGHQLYEYWYPKHRESLLRIGEEIFQKTSFCLCNLSEQGLKVETWNNPDEKPSKFEYKFKWSITPFHGPA